MSSIVGIGTAVPEYKNDQLGIYDFMQDVYDGSEDEKRRLKLLYERSGIKTRYSVIPDYDVSLSERKLYPSTQNLEPFPSLEQRMVLYHHHAVTLAARSIEDIGIHHSLQHLTHLITVSCTGMSAPGLDLELVEHLHLPKNIQRTSINFMGCYAAVHALKLANAICNSETNARVLIVCVELCTLHFQKNSNYDNLTANAIFADGASACLMVSDTLTAEYKKPNFSVTDFYSEVHSTAKNDMAWQLSSSGFLMTLSAYIPQLVESNIDDLVNNALAKSNLARNEIDVWAIHPGGRKILEAIESKLTITKEDLVHSYAILKEFGNMSSATILFVLKRILEDDNKQGNIFGAAFGPGLTMETFIIHK